MLSLDEIIIDNFVAVNYGTSVGVYVFVTKLFIGTFPNNVEVYF